MAICIQILLTEIVGNETNKVTYLKLRIKFYIMNVWVEERKDRTVGLSDDNRPAAVKYYQLTPKGKEIFEKYFKDFEKINETMVNISKKELS